MDKATKIQRKDLLIIITTSPIRSNPHTNIIDMAIESIFKEPTLDNIDIYIICDGVKICQDSFNKYKSGIITQESFKAYQQFKQNLKEKYKQHKRITIEQREQRGCFANNIKLVMEKIEHEFVLIFQHDHVLLRNVDMSLIIEKMKKHPINYIGFMNRSVQKLAYQLDQDLNLRKYFVQKVHYVPQVVKHDHLKFKAKVVQYYQEKYELPLMPLIFWYDKVHIAKRKYYLDVIFSAKGFYDQKNNVYRKTISFVEDSFGCFMRKAIRRKPERIEEMCAFIYWDSMQHVVFHSHGRAFLTKQSKSQLQNQQRLAHQNGHSSQSQKQQQIFQDYGLSRLDN